MFINIAAHVSTVRRANEQELLRQVGPTEYNRLQEEGAVAGLFAAGALLSICAGGLLLEYFFG